MYIDKRWDRLSPSDGDAFARAWIASLRRESDEERSDMGQSVVAMNFTAKPEQQWQFILAAVAHASDAELCHIAAGPMEHLLGHHGADYIDEVERRAEADPKFAQMLSGVWKNMTPDDVWMRVVALQSKPSA